MWLSEANHHARDNCIEFDAVPHKYYVTRTCEGNGGKEQAWQSVTAFSKPYFTQFDAAATISAHYEKWKHDANSKYYTVIRSALQSGGSDSDAKRLIAQGWAAGGQEASAAGTKMHERAELVCNGVGVDLEDAEMAMLKNWMSSFQPPMQWQPWRTEWALWWEDERVENRILVAGTLDLLMHSKATGAFALVDFKRADPKPKYRGAGPNLLGPCEPPGFHPGYAASPLNEVENSKYGAYCVQLNVLAKMLRERYDIDVGHNMYLLQIHDAMESAHCVQVPSHRQAIDAIFAVEAERYRLAHTGL